MNRDFENNMSFGDSLLFSNYIKYNVLSEIINYEFSGSNAETVNLYIDLYSIFKSLYNSNKPLAFNDRYSIASHIINMCSHYRNFFRTRYNVHTKIFLVYSNNDGSVYNKLYYADYSNEIYNNFTNINNISNIIIDNLKILDILVKYIEDIAFINGKFETGVLMYDIMIKEKKSNNNLNIKVPDIIISKDLYNSQLCGFLNGNIIMIRPKKNKGEDLSFSININNAINTYINQRKCNQVANNISSELLSLIMSLTRVPERNIKSYKQIPQTIKLINDCINRGIILNKYNTDVEYICNVLNSNYNANINPYEICQRFNAIDIISQHVAYSSSYQIKYEGIVNLYDPEALKSINSKYFKKNPLDLNVL